MTVERMCQAAFVSRAGYYRNLAEQAPDEEQMAVRAAIQDIALSHRRRYGYRRVSAELRRRGMCVNHKRVARLMREDNLLALGRRKFIATTSSAHELEVYLNLAARMKPDGIDQLWVADLTYIRLAAEFVYLAVVIDRFSRRVIGWSLERTLASRLAVAALELALQRRHPRPGLVHHSDRGTQYASQDYIALLKAHHIVPSMSRPANPYDNAACESFMKTLKQEEIYCGIYRDLADLSDHIEEFIDRYYNRQRLHSALGYRTPEEFEADHAPSLQEGIAGAAKVSFFRHREIYRPDMEGRREEVDPSRSHRSDESPAGYSLASCSPAELASASPADSHSATIDTVRRLKVSEW
jgi:putative transposase